ncbi:unnamed protein product, partial [Cladocopium goreaui]
SAQPVPNFTLLSCDVDLEAMQTMDFATRSAAPMTQTPPVLLDQAGIQALLDEYVTLYTDMRNTCAKMINKELVDAGEQNSMMILEVVGRYNGQLNGLNLATAFHRLARCTSEQQIPEVLLNPDFVKMLDMAQTLAHQELQHQTNSMTAKCSIMILWSLASLETFPTDLFSLLSRVAVPKLRTCEVHDITNLLWSFAKLYKIRPHLIPHVSMETPLVVNTSVDALSQHDLSSFTVQLLISALVSVATLPCQSHGAMWLFSACSQEVAKKWEQIPKKSRSHVAFSFRLMRLQNCLLANSVAKTVTQICPDMHSSVSRPRKGNNKQQKGKPAAQAAPAMVVQGV